LENPLWGGDHKTLVPVVPFVFKVEPQKQKARFTSRGLRRADQTAFRENFILSGNEKKRYNQDEENNAQNNRDPEQRTFNATPSSKDTAGIRAGQTSQACTFAL
jgi:hypothetical protein